MCSSPTSSHRSPQVRIRFLDLESLDEMRARAREVLRRLALPDEDPGRMLRSGDLPAGSLAVLQRWIDTGMSPDGRCLRTGRGYISVRHFSRPVVDWGSGPTIPRRKQHRPLRGQGRLG